MISSTNPLKILICGGGCAGPALAFWLSRAGHNVTVVERFPALRASGAQIDLREQGIEVVKRMGLLEAVRGILVDEAGVAHVDSENIPWATFMANKSGKGKQSMTSEYEIMRGDLVRLLYTATKDDVSYVFGKTVEHFEQDESCVTVYFSDGQIQAFDILVGADGQGSRIRSAILPPDTLDPIRHLGVYMAYWFNPRESIDSNIRKVYHMPGSRIAMSRSHCLTETQAYFSLRDDSEELRSLPRASIEMQKKFWSDKFKGSGWQVDRFIDGMRTTENFYCQEIVQVRTNTWSKGRVVLLGDAAHCPSPMTGMGTTSAFVGAYVLAGEINKNSNDIPLAFANYDETLRPFINEIQQFNTRFLDFAFPQTQTGIFLIHLLVAIISFFRIVEIKNRFSSEKRGGWDLPYYSDVLNVGHDASKHG